MKRVGIARWAAVTAGLLSFTLAGCQSTGTSESDSSAQTGSEFDQGAGDTRGSREPVALETVYFDFDRYNIRADAGSVLRKNAAVIEENADWGTITVEGNTDERGTEEYNLALGERRANAVKRYLVDLGVPSSRLRTVSFGELRPAVPGHDESAWRYNRRCNFKAGS